MAQACLNGARQMGSHPALPVTAHQLAVDAVAVAELGVRSVHVHPRDPAGAEVLAGPDIAAAVSAMRAAVPDVEIGVTTAAWIEPDPVVRTGLVAGWRGLAAGRPDFASVNVHEPGWLEVSAALHASGIGIELGVFHQQAARLLRERGLPPGTVRVLVEVQPGRPPLAEAAGLLAELSWVDAPILLHGEDDTAWPVFAEALRLGTLTRIGLEDTLFGPDGARVAGNADLVVTARRLAEDADSD
ncbi:MAG: 3-keto-5-aminohexanoate cleavage protein [Kutzneria sp.]|nr:3-keto-5-aminohexanoate cleavage protein [Kutzneria sp.]MBV9843981.1 3-keto-5-aminohexanoate cleavage protein [Kutzneria sp.]